MDNNVKRLRPHEQRVVEERAELDVRTHALGGFIGTPLFKRLDEDEQVRLAKQLTAMTGYLEILNDRISAFPPIPDNDPLITAQPVTPIDRNAYKEAVLADEPPIADMDSFAMLVDDWHAEKMEYGNRLLEIPEGTSIQIEQDDKPGEIIQMNLDGAYHTVFRTGVLTTLQLFKQLPFGVSVKAEEDVG